jgi:hypothetical protein
MVLATTIFAVGLAVPPEVEYTPETTAALSLLTTSITTTTTLMSHSHLTSDLSQVLA